MNIETTKLEGVFILKPKIYEDERGFFTESYNKLLLEKHGIHTTFVQDNHSFTKKTNVIRGLHYQIHPKAQTKLVRVCAGAILDVVVDIRKDSPTFRQWISCILSEENMLQIFIPKGFAHGFCTLKPNTHVLYKVDEYYDPFLEQGIIWNDRELNIHWPTKEPILSEKDKNHPTFNKAQLLFS